MIPFSLEYKSDIDAGKLRVVTAYGEPARVVFTEGLGPHPVLAVIYEGDTTDSAWYSTDGKDFRGEQGLFLVSDENFNLEKETRELWESLPRHTHALYEKLKVYGIRCFLAGIRTPSGTEFVVKEDRD